jgi:hypothetical protein
MEHAGFDGLHNPAGMLALALSLLAITWIIIFGSFKVKAAMIREKAMRAEMRRAHEETKNEKTH